MTETKATKLTLPIEVGKRYLRRDGAVVKALRAAENVTWTTADTVVFTATGRTHQILEHSYDLIADYVEPAAAQAPSAEHSHAELLRWIADGKQVQWRVNGDKWDAISLSHIFMNLADGDLLPMSEFRLKPRTIMVGDIEIEAPLREAPAEGTRVYTANPFSPELHNTFLWSSPFYLLDKGFVFATQAAAVAASNAILALFAPKVAA